MPSNVEGASLPHPVDTRVNHISQFEQRFNLVRVYVYLIQIHDLIDPQKLNSFISRIDSNCEYLVLLRTQPLTMRTLQDSRYPP